MEKKKKKKGAVDMLTLERTITIDPRKREKFMEDMKKNAADKIFWDKTKEATSSINISKLDELFKK